MSVMKNSAWFAVAPRHGSGSRTVEDRLLDLLLVELSELSRLRDSGIVVAPGARGELRLLLSVDVEGPYPLELLP